jgi:hypothetical protein
VARATIQADDITEQEKMTAAKAAARDESAGG